MAEDPGIENERRLAHAAPHRVVHGKLERADGLIRESRSTRLAPGVARVFAPGEMAAALERRQRTGGVPANEMAARGNGDAAARPGGDASALR